MAELSRGSTKAGWEALHQEAVGQLESLLRVKHEREKDRGHVVGEQLMRAAQMFLDQPQGDAMVVHFRPRAMPTIGGPEPILPEKMYMTIVPDTEDRPVRHVKVINQRGEAVYWFGERPSRVDPDVEDAMRLTLRTRPSGQDRLDETIAIATDLVNEYAERMREAADG